MCQLIFSNLYGIPNLNPYLIFRALLQCSKATHKDGNGFFSYGKVKGKYKEFWRRNGIEPEKELNFALAVQENTVEGVPIMGHVRNASLTKGQRIVTTAKTHPFIYNNIALAHNGVLELEDGKDFPDDMIDSEYFATVLNKEREASENLFDALKKTYEKFKGKFAFIIFDKKSEKYYIARGKADLHKIDVYRKVNEEKVSLGYFIITELYSAKEVFEQLKLYVSWEYGIELSADWVLLKENTVFEIEDKELKEVGSIVEKDRFPRGNTVVVGGTRPLLQTTQHGASNHFLTGESLKYTKFLEDFIVKFSMSPFDLDIFSLFINKTTIFQLDYMSLRKLSTKLGKVWNIAKKDCAIKGKLKALRYIKRCLPYSSHYELACTQDLEFPLFLNTLEKLHTLKAYAKKVSIEGEVEEDINEDGMDEIEIVIEEPKAEILKDCPVHFQQRIDWSENEEAYLGGE